LLELRRVSKHFSSIPAVDDVSFSARPGEVTGYLGPNGSGKSTTMKMITGLIEMTLGHILFQGKPIQDDLIAYKRRMGYVPEEPYLYNHLSGLEYLAMVAQLRGLPARQSSERIDGMLRLLSLHDDRHASISGYSKGMR
jgi:ABC-2 type transport system ATP-binding protein